MSKHTPGPWHLGRPDGNGEDAHMCEVMTKYTTASEAGTLPCYDIICRTWSPKHLVASVRLTRPECQAYARLIAAAPELLEALKEVAAEARHPDYDWSVALLKTVHAAIAKAEEVKP